jgi:hypothetical protein
MTDEPATIGERYSRAISSGHLEMRDRRGDIDVVIAAGLSGDSLASNLFRLAVEYDAVRGDHRAAEDRLKASEDHAAQKCGAEAERITQSAKDAALTAHVLSLSQLRSLWNTKQLFGEFARQEATRHHFMRSDKDVSAIAGRVLDAWMRPLCGSCNGRGFSGGSHRGEMQTVCRACRGSGQRRDGIGQTEGERRFVGRLLMRISELLALAQREISANRKTVDEAKKMIDEAASS